MNPLLRLLRYPGAVAGITLALLLVSSLAVEHWYREVHRERQHAVTLSQLHSFDEALEGAVNRRLATLPALRTYLESAPPGTEIRRDLDAFAEGLHASAPGIRALQYVRGGVIRYTSRLKDNRPAFGYNLLADPRPEVRQDVMRALASDWVVLSGPLDLIQGGRGFVARLATFLPGDPRFGLVAAVMEVEPIFLEAGFGSSWAGIRLAVRDGNGRLLAGDPEVFAQDPVTVAVSVTGGTTWHLAGLPLQGWATAGPAVWGVRIGLALVSLLGTALGWTVSARQMRLRRAVSARTRALSVANERLEAKVHEVEVAEDAVRAQHTLLRAVIEGSPDLILVRDREGRYMLANDAAGAALGRAADDVVGRTARDVFAATDAPDIDAIDHAVLTSAAPLTRERRLPTPAGERTYLLAVHPWMDERGEAAGTVTVARDVTERLTLENQLRHAQKLDALGRLSGGIAHDFNNVLTAILAGAHLLAQNLPASTPELAGDVDDIRAAAQRGAELTRKLLAFGRRDMLERQPLDLVSVVADTAAMARRLLPAHIDVRTELPSPPVTVAADHGALSQILLNLVTNARDAMPVEGRLEISLSRKLANGRAIARLAVRDTGIGMDEATRAHIFEPFFTTKPPGAGTGLGLSIAYGLIQQHDGAIAVESEPGRGTTVTIDLPVVSEAPTRPEAPPVNGAALPGGAETILVVEDEDAIRTTARRVLGHQGYRVLTARDGQEGLETLRRDPGIALVITDMVMPRMGGAELSQLARQAGVRAPFLFTTGYPSLTGATGGDPADGALLLKPWQPEDLLEKVRELLDAAAGRSAP
jgi:PAS domain S-box-containing protein